MTSDARRDAHQPDDSRQDDSVQDSPDLSHSDKKSSKEGAEGSKLRSLASSWKDRGTSKARELKERGIEKAHDLKAFGHDTLEQLKAKAKSSEAGDDSKTDSESTSDTGQGVGTDSAPKVDLQEKSDLEEDSQKKTGGSSKKARSRGKKDPKEKASKDKTPEKTPAREIKVEKASPVPYGQGRYTSAPSAVVRRAAQTLLLKPAVWSALRVHVHGRSHLNHLEGPFIAISNHSSHFDAPLIFGALPKRHSKYLATGAAADYFFDHWWKSAPVALFFNAFPVNRGGSRGRKGMAGRLLSSGVPLLLFPEGTRSRTGAMGPFKPGSAALCISRDVPCIPIALVGAYAAWPYDQDHWNPGRPHVHVVIGEPMYPQPGEIAHQFSERMRRKVIELHDTTARAYNMKTLADYGLPIAIERAKSGDNTALNKETSGAKPKKKKRRRFPWQRKK